MPDHIFWPSAFILVGVSLLASALLVYVLRGLNLNQRQTQYHEMYLIGKGLVLSNLLCILTAGFGQACFVLMLRKFASSDTTRDLCWVAGSVNYWWVLNSHIWSIGLALRLYLGLLQKVSPDRIAETTLSRVNSKHIWWTAIVMNSSYCVFIIGSSAMSTHGLITTTGGCWSKLPGSYILVPVLVVFLLEALLMVSTVRLLNANQTKFPHKFQQSFGAIFRFTFSVLFLDASFCVAIASNHALVNWFGVAESWYVVAMEGIYCWGVYGILLAAAFLWHNHGTNRLFSDKGAFVAVVFDRMHDSAEEGRGAEWRATTEALISEERNCLNEKLCPKVQTWKVENADDLPFKFVRHAVDMLLTPDSLSLHISEMILDENEELFDQAMWDIYDGYTEEKASASRKQTGRFIDLNETISAAEPEL